MSALDLVTRVLDDADECRFAHVPKEKIAAFIESPEFLERLPSIRHRAVIGHRFAIWGFDGPMKQATIGRIHSVTGARVSQLQKRALSIIATLISDKFTAPQ